MKAAIVFTGSGPILILTTFDSIANPKLAEKLAARGIARFIAYEVPVEKVKAQYGNRFQVILGDLSQTSDLRVMDIDGHHVFNNFSLEELGTPIYWVATEKTVPDESRIEETEREWLYVRIDEYGKLVESNFVPMLGSRFDPSIPAQSGPASQQARFQLDQQGVVINGSPHVLNGRRLILHGRSSPALGRTDTVIPSCSWRPDQESGWT